MRTLVLAKTIVFNDADKLLTLRRSDDDHHRPGGFDFPGGKLDDGETTLEGALREAAEESGLELRAADMYLVFAHNEISRRDDLPEEINIIWLGYVTKVTGNPKVRLSVEHKRFSWVTLEDALEDCEAPTAKLFLTQLRDHDIVSGLFS